MSRAPLAVLALVLFWSAPAFATYYRIEAQAFDATEGYEQYASSKIVAELHIDVAAAEGQADIGPFCYRGQYIHPNCWGYADVVESVAIEWEGERVEGGGLRSEVQVDNAPYWTPGLSINVFPVDADAFPRVQGSSLFAISIGLKGADPPLTTSLAFPVPVDVSGIEDPWDRVFALFLDEPRPGLAGGAVLFEIDSMVLIPEPGTALFLGFGLVGLARSGRRRRG